MDRQAQRDIRRKLNCLRFAQERGSNVLATSHPEKLAKMIKTYETWWAGVESSIVYVKK